MPNWCYQYVEVVGKGEDIKELIEAVRNREPQEDVEHPVEWNINQLFPIPQKLVDTRAGSFADGSPEQIENERKEKENLVEFGSKNWYDWAYANWDTKWGACDIDLDPDDLYNNQFSFKFESAWGPAIGLLRKVSELFPKLIIGVHYTEESEAFAGWHVFHKGEVTEEGSVEPTLPEINTKEFEALSEDEQMEKICERGNQVIQEICDGMYEGILKISVGMPS